jgi:hypothetical protein
MDSKLSVGSIQLPSQWIKQQGHEADYSSHLVSRLRMVELYLHFLICHHGTVLIYIIKYRDNFTFLPLLYI